MNGGDVHPDEMNAPHDFDDAAADALIAGHGQSVDPGLADVVGDMRLAYASQPPVVGAELSALITNTSVPAPTVTPSRRFQRMRSSAIAKIGAATATLLAATGGLAAAHALPSPVQNAVSHLGIGASAQHNSEHALTVEPTTIDPSPTTMTAAPTTVPTTATTTPDNPAAPGDTTPTTAEPTDNDDNGSAVDNHDANGDNHACDAHHDDQVADDTAVPAGPVTPAPAMPCVPTTDTTHPQTSDGHDDSNGDTHHRASDNTTVTTTPPPDQGNSNSGGDHSSGSSSDHGGGSGSSGDNSHSSGDGSGSHQGN